MLQRCKKAVMCLMWHLKERVWLKMITRLQRWGEEKTVLSSIEREGLYDLVKMFGLLGLLAGVNWTEPGL